MSSQEIQALKDAYQLSPENPHIFIMLVEALAKCGDVAGAHQIICDSSCDVQSVAERVMLGKLCLQCKDYHRALTFCSGETADELLVRAKACLALMNLEEGREYYQRALHLNPVLEDVDLEKSLNSTVVNFNGQQNTVKLKVVSTKQDKVLRKETEAEEVEEKKVNLKAQISNVTFADIGGLNKVKQQIHKKIILPFTKPFLYK